MANKIIGIILLCIAGIVGIGISMSWDFQKWIILDWTIIFVCTATAIILFLRQDQARPNKFFYTSVIAMIVIAGIFGLVNQQINESTKEYYDKFKELDKSHKTFREYCNKDGTSSAAEIDPSNTFKVNLSNLKKNYGLEMNDADCRRLRSLLYQTSDN